MSSLREDLEWLAGLDYPRKIDVDTPRGPGGHNPLRILSLTIVALMAGYYFWPGISGKEEAGHLGAAICVLLFLTVVGEILLRDGPPGK